MNSVCRFVDYFWWRYGLLSKCDRSVLDRFDPNWNGYTYLTEEELRSVLRLHARGLVPYFEGIDLYY